MLKRNIQQNQQNIPLGPVPNGHIPNPNQAAQPLIPAANPAAQPLIPAAQPLIPAADPAAP